MKRSGLSQYAVPSARGRVPSSAVESRRVSRLLWVSASLQGMGIVLSFRCAERAQTTMKHERKRLRSGEIGDLEDRELHGVRRLRIVELRDDVILEARGINRGELHVGGSRHVERVA